MSITRHISVTLHGETPEDYLRIISTLAKETPEAQGWQLISHPETRTITAEKLDKLP